MSKETTTKRKRASNFMLRESESELRRFHRQPEPVALNVKIEKSIHDNLLMRQQYLSEKLGYNVPLDKVAEELLMIAMENIGDFQIWLSKAQKTKTTGNGNGSESGSESVNTAASAVAAGAATGTVKADAKDAKAGAKGGAMLTAEDEDKLLENLPQ